MTVSIQLSTVNNIFKATVSKETQEIREYYLESRRKKNPAIFKTIINTKLVLLENAMYFFDGYMKPSTL